MWNSLRTDLARLLAQRIESLFDVTHLPVMETPKRREHGDVAFPAALHLARTLKRNPRQIAADLLEDFPLPEGVIECRMAGAGYLNFFFDRSRLTASLLTDDPADNQQHRGAKVVVEHTNINPNKAAHIGHLRNAVLGDILVKSLTFLGHEVETQNYIDDTGVQVADVVVGFMDIEGKTLEDVAELPEPFDYYCWDLYSRVGSWYEEDDDRKELRRQTLHQLEAGKGPRSKMGDLVARRVLARHLKTMARLGISYDLLTRESNILGLDFFSTAFERLKKTGAIRKEEKGKNQGCWVMPLSTSEEFAGLEDPDKVIVRSDGTITYVGKDIAYQLWKFGLLGQDFSYRIWEEVGLWETAQEGELDHPAFGNGRKVINVIDTRQSYLQKIVRVGLESLGHHEEAENSVHFAYEMVALSHETSRQLGYLDESHEGGKALEMSGRKGIGVKADDLLDQMIARAQGEIVKRNRELEENEVTKLATQIAVAALRFFMVKAGTNRVIAFDFDEAMAFEGETGPYLQYALVRVQNIWRKLEEAGIATHVSASSTAEIESWPDDLWDLTVAVAQIPEVVARATETLELSLMARSALDLAQKFNAIYHRYPILHADDPTERQRRLVAVEVFFRGLSKLMDLMGIPIPTRM